MSKVFGSVVSIQRGEPVVNYLVSIKVKTATADDETDETLTTPFFFSARTNSDGEFSIDLDVVGDLVDPVEISVATPGGLVVAELERKLASINRAIAIRVRVPPANRVEATDEPSDGVRQRLSGTVVHSAGSTVPAGLPVVIWGKEPANGQEHAPKPLLVTKTQVQGALSGEWPSTELASAYGTVNGSAELPIGLVDGRLPKEVTLVIDELDADVPCDCDELAPRAPDPADLTGNPGAFAQDLGGGCTDLTTPNRALEEFTYSFAVRTTQPNVRAMTLGWNPLVPKAIFVDLMGVAVANVALKGELATAPSPDVSDYQMDVETALGLVQMKKIPSPETLSKAAWLSNVTNAKAKLAGFTGRPPVRAALNAESPIDWDDTPTIHLSTEIAFGHLVRYKEVWRADGYSLGDLLYSLPLAPNQRRRVAVVDWERRTTAARAETLEFEESLDAVIQRDRDVQEIVGTDLHESTSGGSRNTTYGFSAGIGGGFLSGAFGIFGGVSGGVSGSRSNAWQDSSRRFSADSLQKLRDRVGQRSSAVRAQRSTVVNTVAQGESVAAASEVVANYNRCHAMTVEYFEVLRHFLVTHELGDVDECLFVPFPITPFDMGKALRWRTFLSAYLKDRSLRPGFASLQRVIDNWSGWDYPTSRYSEEAPNTVEGELRISFLLPRPRDDADGEFQIDEWRPYERYVPWYMKNTWNRMVELAARLNLEAQAARDKAFTEEIAPEIAERLVNELRFSFVGEDGGETAVPLDGTLVSRFVENRGLYVTIRPAGELPNIPREDIAYFRIAYEGNELPPDAKIIVRSGKVRYRSDHMTALLFNERRLLDDLSAGDSVSVATPVSRRELRNPREEDRRRADRLVEHLNENLEYYHQVIWVNLDPERRYMLLDSIRVPGQAGKSVAGMCINELIGVVGNSLVLPVAPGQKLDPTIERVDENGNPVDVRDAYVVPPSPPLRVSVPTRGVYAEAISGDCSACEEIDDTRYWRWSTEGLLGPPEIKGPISTESRRAEEQELTPTDLPGPLVQIQNAPEVPDPVGLKGAFDLLAKPELFKDITGLEGTQKNAMKAFDTAVSAASAMGSQAAALARQAELSKTADKMVDRVGKALKNEMITPEQAEEITGSIIDGLNGKAEEIEETPAKDKKVEAAAKEAAKNAEAASLKVKSGGETVEASFSGKKPSVGSAPVVGKLDITSGPRIESRLPASRERNPRVNVIDQAIATRGDLDIALGGRYTLWRDTVKAFRDDGATGYKVLRHLAIAYPGNAKDKSKLVAGGRLPLVIIAHANHHPVLVANPRVRSDPHMGYDYLQEALAKKGIVSVSVDMSAAYAVNSFVDMRARLLLDALEELKDMDKSATRFKDRLDFKRVVFVGHSRGGEAVCRAAVLNEIENKGYGVKGVCSIAPMDITGTHGKNAGQARWGTELTKSNAGFYLVLYGARDGDVGGWNGARSLSGTGFRLYDRAKCDKAMFFFDKANHNRFNRKIMSNTGDDTKLAAQKSVLMSQTDHEKIAMQYIEGLCSWAFRGQAGGLSLLRNDTKNTVTQAFSHQWSFGKSIEVLQALDDPANPPTLVGAEIKAMPDVRRQEAPAPAETMLKETNHNITVGFAIENAPAPAAPAFSIDLPAGQRDWRSFDYLTFRVAADMDLASKGAITSSRKPAYIVSLTDAASKVENVSSSSHRLTKPVFHEDPVPGSGGRIENVSVVRLETVSIKLSDLASLQLNDVRNIQIIPNAGFARKMFFDSIQLVKS